MEYRRTDLEKPLEEIRGRYGMDFRHVSRAVLSFRLSWESRAAQFPDLSSFIKRLLDDRAFFLEKLPLFSPGTTDVFRDPFFFGALRRQVLPDLSTRSPLRIWIPSILSGEELFSLLVVLREERREDAIVFASEYNETLYRKSQDFSFSGDRENSCNSAYLKSGGKKDLPGYCTRKEGRLMADPSLYRNVHFDRSHPLDGTLPSPPVDLILGRNIAISWIPQARSTLLNRWIHNLTPGGFLCLGYRERFPEIATNGGLEIVDERENILRKR